MRAFAACLMNLTARSSALAVEESPVARHTNVNAHARTAKTGREMLAAHVGFNISVLMLDSIRLLVPGQAIHAMWALVRNSGVRGLRRFASSRRQIAVFRLCGMMDGIVTMAACRLRLFA